MKKYIIAAFSFLVLLAGYLFKRKESAEALLKNQETKQKDLDLQKEQLNNKAVIQSEEEKQANKEVPVAEDKTQEEVVSWWKKRL